MSNPVFLISIAERRSRSDMDFHNLSAIHDADVRLSAFNVISACLVGLLLTALIIILVVAYIRAKSKTAIKRPVSSSVTVESNLDSISITNNNDSSRLTSSFFACTNNNQYCYDSIVAV
ncbi:hypothetical protein GCK32_015361 [Trichostrongylus colubriformis]|uniref:Uncharacterized protein n=1 Tax=Trichostrongylus colubriformis TaxID=6319 RepID=A0AAN8ISE8_TRICO